MSGFKKASKSKIKLRGAIFGPSGSGKTYTSLKILVGMGCKKIAFIDSERGSSLRYADKFDFDQIDLESKEIIEYIKWIEEAQKEGYDGLIIDSMSHAWDKLLEAVDKIAKAKYKGNTWSAWSEGTPQQHKFINAILNFDGHIMATMRSKTEWETEKTSDGKNRPVRIGLSPNQGKGIEYEFDFLLEMNTENICTVIKDRTGKFQGEIIEKPSEAFGKKLADWLSQGNEPAPVAKSKPYTEMTITEELEAAFNDCHSSDDWKSTQEWMLKQAWYSENQTLCKKLFNSGYATWKQLEASVVGEL